MRFLGRKERPWGKNGGGSERGKGMEVFGKGGERGREDLKGRNGR